MVATFRSFNFAAAQLAIFVLLLGLALASPPASADDKKLCPVDDSGQCRNNTGTSSCFPSEDDSDKGGHCWNIRSHAQIVCKCLHKTPGSRGHSSINIGIGVGFGGNHGQDENGTRDDHHSRDRPPADTQSPSNDNSPAPHG